MARRAWRELIHVLAGPDPAPDDPGGYQPGAFPATWGEWNDRYRDDVRRFWRGVPPASTSPPYAAGR